jgi:hypothetical protein
MAGSQRTTIFSQKGAAVIASHQSRQRDSQEKIYQQVHDIISIFYARAAAASSFLLFATLALGNQANLQHDVLGIFYIAFQLS